MKLATPLRLVALTTSVLFTPLALFAQGRAAAVEQPPAYQHYYLVDLGTFGGPTSDVSTEPEQNVINSAGSIVGGADTSLPTPEPGCFNPIFNPDCFIFHAFVWRHGYLNDLGTLPGGNYSFAGEINDRGQIVGVSETNQVDPAAGNPEFHAVLWDQEEQIHDLGTLGGTASIAGVLNNRGQVVGVSLNTIPDPLSILALGGNLTLTQTHGFMWQDGRMQDLGTLGGPDSWASFINDRGQIAGASYTSNVVDPDTGTPQIDLFIWENGSMKDLGNLGGNNGLLGAPTIVTGINASGEITGIMALAGDEVGEAFLWNGRELLDLGSLGAPGSFGRGINDAGEVVGLADLPGTVLGGPPNHGFLWRGGLMIDLGTLGDDPCSDALAINSRGQVVGASQSTAGGCNAWTTAFLWQRGGPMVDLNALVRSDSGVHLFAAEAINDRGEIVVAGAPEGCEVLNSGACQHIYALIPCDQDHPGIDGCDYSPVPVIPASAAHSTDKEQPPGSTADGRKLSPAEARARFLAKIRDHDGSGMLRR